MTTEPTTTTDRVMDLIDQALAPGGTHAQRAMRALGNGMPPEDLEPEAAAELERWRIDGERTATWAVNRLRRAQRLRDEANATADELHQLANDHVAEVERQTAHDIRFFESKLREYHEERVAGTRKHTTTVPGAKLADRAGGVSTEIDPSGEEAVADWCTDHLPEAVDYVTKLDKAKLKAKLSAKVSEEPGTYPAVHGQTGEVVEGVTFTRGERTFAVTFSEPEPEAEPEPGITAAEAERIAQRAYDARREAEIGAERHAAELADEAEREAYNQARSTE